MISDRSNGERNSKHQRGIKIGQQRYSRTTLILVFLILSVIEALIIIYLVVNISILQKENGDLVTVEKQHSSRIAEVEPELEKLKIELAALTESRLPNLKKLEFDSVIAIDNKIIKNINFTISGHSISGKGTSKTYEYKIVLHNNTLTDVHPEMDVLLFDRAGIQVGVSRIGVRPDGTSTLEVLERGETRSFSSSIDLPEEIKPEYFMLKVTSPN